MRSIRAVTAAAVLAALLAGGCVKLNERRVTHMASQQSAWKPGRMRIPMPESARRDTTPREIVVQRSYYRVAKTDDLVSISERFYRTAYYSHDLFVANEDRISAAGGLKRGLVITLPPEEEMRSFSNYKSRP